MAGRREVWSGSNGPGRLLRVAAAGAAGLRVVSLNTCASARVAHEPTAGRFGDISEIVVSPDSGVVRRADRFGRYASPTDPDSARRSRENHTK